MHHVSSWRNPRGYICREYINKWQSISGLKWAALLRKFSNSSIYKWFCKAFPITPFNNYFSSFSSNKENHNAAEKLISDIGGTNKLLYFIISFKHDTACWSLDLRSSSISLNVFSTIKKSSCILDLVLKNLPVWKLTEKNSWPSIIIVKEQAPVQNKSALLIKKLLF